MRKLSSKLTVTVMARKITTSGQQTCLEPPSSVGAVVSNPRCRGQHQSHSASDLKGPRVRRSLELHKNAAVVSASCSEVVFRSQ